MADENEKRAAGGTLGLTDEYPTDDDEIVARWLDDLSRSHQVVSTRAREVSQLVRLAGRAFALEERATLRRLAESICRLQKIVFSELDELTEPKDPGTIP